MSFRVVLPWGAAVAAVLLCASPFARASCGSANCFFVTGTQEGINSPGQVTLDLSFKYIPQDRKLQGTGSVDEVLVPKVDFESHAILPDHHREISTMSYLFEAGLNVGLTKRTGCRS